MKKINLILYLLTFFTVQNLNGQTLDCIIKGTFTDSTKYKYAYLVDLKAKKFIKTAIARNNFSFIVAKPKNYLVTQLYLEDDSIKTISYFLEQAKRAGVNRRIIAIEDADLIFGKNALDIKVIKGKLNEDIVQMYKTMETKEFNLFFAQHPDSQISITLLKALVRLNKVFENAYDCKAFFNQLSDRLQKSEEGKSLLLLL